MGFLKKALGKSVGGKLLGKAIKKDPIASRLIKKDPLGSKLVGASNRRSKVGGEPMGAAGRIGNAMLGKRMKTGGVMPPTRASTPAKKMSALASPGMRRKFNP